MARALCRAMSLEATTCLVSLVGQFSRRVAVDCLVGPTLSSRWCIIPVGSLLNRWVWLLGDT